MNIQSIHGKIIEPKKLTMEKRSQKETVLKAIRERQAEKEEKAMPIEGPCEDNDQTVADDYLDYLHSQY